MSPRICLVALLFCLPTFAQDDPAAGLPLPSARPAGDLLGDRVLRGRLEWVSAPEWWKLGEYWLVTADERRYHVVRTPRTQVVTDMSHGWLKTERFELRASVSLVEGTLTARVLEVFEPASVELRATLVEEGGVLHLDLGDRRLRVREEFSGPQVVRAFLGRTVDVRAFVFKDGTALVRAVKARARAWHFNPIVLPNIIIPRWRPAGTEYWVHYVGADGKALLGSWRIAVEDLDANAETAGDEATGVETREGLLQALERAQGE